MNYGLQIVQPSKDYFRDEQSSGGRLAVLPAFKAARLCNPATIPSIVAGEQDEGDGRWLHDTLSCLNAHVSTNMVWFL
jgi:hypothetical protein